jgi:long-chain acyl-CoA synthetase
MTETEQPSDLLRRYGDRAAVVMGGSGETVTFAELDDRSTRLARVFDRAGLGPGDHVAVMLHNEPHFFTVIWAALRAGLFLTPINWHLGPEEAGYIIRDCGAKAFVTSGSLHEVATDLAPHLEEVALRLMVGGDGAGHVVAGYDDLDATVARESGDRRSGERSGTFMMYSSGTTGRPKGILPRLPEAPFGLGSDAVATVASLVFGVDESTVYLSPAPLYHAAPIGWCTAVQRLGGTVVVMERFDAAATLDLVERHQVTHAQFVPTHFVRMLRLPDDVRTGHDLSSLRKVLHAAAPCPVPVKQQMLEWLGPIVDEYYGGSEAFGICIITADDWLQHPGSVGKPLLGPAHIVGADGVELPAGETGQIWFETAAEFRYHNDPDKTAQVLDERGWATYGDVGHLDAEGYLYLTDRVSNMIISGGVNIYPQEAENVLAVHPEVEDVAVIGVPDEEMGERVKAFVVLRTPTDDRDRMAAGLIAYCRDELAHYKCPREVAFVDGLPRMDNGKLLKRNLLATGERSQAR